MDRSIISTAFTLTRVSVAAIPENYEDRLTEMFPGTYRHLCLMALDPYDIALSKLERNSQKDRDDVRFLAQDNPVRLERLAGTLRHRIAVATRTARPRRPHASALDGNAFRVIGTALSGGTSYAKSEEAGVLQFSTLKTMLLTISTTHQHATDLGYLLHKNPARVQTEYLSLARRTSSTAEASPELCTAGLLVKLIQLLWYVGEDQLARWAAGAVRKRSALCRELLPD